MADTNTKEMDGVEINFDARTTEQWAEITKIVPKGYICVEFTSDEKCRLKVGDGTKQYSELPYAGGDVDPAEIEKIAQRVVSDAFGEQGIMFHYKGRVNSPDDLPADGNKTGDVWLVGDESTKEFAEYYWTGTFFDYMGRKEEVDFSEYYKKSDVDTLLLSKAEKEVVDGLSNRLTELEETCVRSTDRLILTCKMN